MTSKSFDKLLAGYAAFREKYTKGEDHLMANLAKEGQQPEALVIACCDSRVDPALLLQCNPGDLFVVRNIANIVPPYECDAAHHGTSAAIEFAVCYLHVKHIIILGHSQCGGINALLNKDTLDQDDFISNWVDLINIEKTTDDVNHFAKCSLIHSYHNALTFPWVKERVRSGKLKVHTWFFEIDDGKIYTHKHEDEDDTFHSL